MTNEQRDRLDELTRQREAASERQEKAERALADARKEARQQ